jgi:hypothetical protein|tara:strand:+ start:814 stop:1017 length:204 start_codon:yes stop_codon:yes gene_type:complete
VAVPVFAEDVLQAKAISPMDTKVILVIISFIFMKQIYPANNSMSTPSGSYSLVEKNDRFKFNKIMGP